jgi:opacity protein-like surface antigen
MAWRKGIGVFLMLAPLATGLPAAAEEAPPFAWRGFYIGYHLGGALHLVDVDDPFGSSIFGDTVRTPGPLAGGQLGYNWQRGAALAGFEADVSWADMDGTNTCFAYSGFFISANCRAKIDALGTFVGRLGWILPSDGRTLVFGKAGVAWAHSQIDATPNGGLGLAGTGDDGVAWGWTRDRCFEPRHWRPLLVDVDHERQRQLRWHRRDHSDALRRRAGSPSPARRLQVRCVRAGLAYEVGSNALSDGNLSRPSNLAYTVCIPRP